MPTPTFVTINGNAYPVANDGTPAQTPVFIGTTSRAFAGNLRSTQQPVKREWVFNTTEIDDATLAALQADAAAGAVPGNPLCGGDEIGTPVACVVIITTWQPLYDGGTIKRIVTFNIKEV